MRATSGWPRRPAAPPCASVRPEARRASRGSRPDGSQIAFSGNYDGNLDIYVVPATGGLPKRLTYHGDPDRMLDWYPDGKSILFATSRTSEKDRFNQLYKISAEGGLPEKLPVPYGEFGAISPDGKTLAYIPISVDFRTWKRYRGGMNPAIWLFDLETFAAKNITGNDSRQLAADVARLDAVFPLRPRQEQARQHLGLRHQEEQTSARSPRSRNSTFTSPASGRRTSCSRTAAGFTC